MCRLKDFPASTLLKEGYYLSFSHKNVSFSSIFLCLCTPIPSKWFFKKLMPWQFMFVIALVLNIIRSILKVNIAPRLHMISLYRVHSATGIVVHWWLTFIKESSGLSTKEPDIHQFIEARIALWVSWVVQTVITQNSRLQVFIWTIMMISFAFLQKSSLLRAPCQATFSLQGCQEDCLCQISALPLLAYTWHSCNRKETFYNKKQAPKWDFGTISSPSPLRMRRFIWWTADLAKVGVLTPGCQVVR